MAAPFLGPHLPSLRLASVALVGGYAILGAAGFGLVGALVHATWFWLLLTHAGRRAVLVTSAILGGVWLMACATPSAGPGLCTAGAALLTLMACGWMAVGGVH